MMAHIQGTGAMTYPNQDPRELRAALIRNAFEVQRSAFGAFVRASEAYTSAAILGRATTEKREAMRAAAVRYGRATGRAEHLALEMAESSDVPVIHDRGAV